MSIDIQWDKISPENRAAWNEQIRTFLDSQFRSINLPSYIEEIRVLAFDLGNEPPELTIKHIGDPFQEFYEYGLALDRQEELNQELNDTAAAAAAAAAAATVDESDDNQHDHHNPQQPATDDPPLYRHISRPSLSQSFSRFGINEAGGGGLYQNAWPGIPRIQTPVIGISGLSSNRRHAISLPVTPLGGGEPGGFMRNSFSDAIARRGTETTPDPESDRHQQQQQQQQQQIDEQDHHNGPAHTHHLQDYKVSDNDMQILNQVHYNGNIQIRIAVNLRLDYPSQTFMTLPINLMVTGLELDFVGVIAYISQRIFFSILGPSNTNLNQLPTRVPAPAPDFDVLKNIRIESEIGDHSSRGGSVMKNVGKLEKFVVEKIKNMLYEEVIWPAWITLEL